MTAMMHETEGDRLEEAKQWLLCKAPEGDPIWSNGMIGCGPTRATERPTPKCRRSLIGMTICARHLCEASVRGLSRPMTPEPSLLYLRFRGNANHDGTCAICQQIAPAYQSVNVRSST